MKKVLIAGLVGGFVMFVWGIVTHVVLPIGDIGIDSISKEDAVVSVLRESIPEAGLYFFPGMDMSTNPTDQDQKAWAEKYKKGPRGILVYQPSGAEPFDPLNMVTQFVSDTLAALMAAMLLFFVGRSFRIRLLAVVLMGVFAWLTISVPYWTWYGFPLDFTVGQALDTILGWTLTGLVLAAMVRPAQA